MNELSPGERRKLRADAHHLNPVVTIASNGLTPEVLAEIDRSLQAHELIKIKVHGAERNDREMMLQTICNSLDAAAVQHIGTILVVWRQRREDDDSAKPVEPKPVRSIAKAKSARAFAAAARRTALIQKAAAEKKRGPARRPRGLPGKV
jgi:putative YhbY family RNA-binding protein